MNYFKAISACAIVAVSLAAFGCNKNDRRNNANTPAANPSTSASTGTDAATAANREINLDEFLDNWERYVGQDVTVVGKVDKVLSPVALQLKDSDPVAADKLLVFVPKDAQATPFDSSWEGARVRLMGPAARMSLTDVEERVGIQSAEIQAELKKQGPTIIARSVTQVP